MRIGGFAFRIGIVAVCVVGFHAVADSAILQGVGRDSIDVKVLIAESLAVIPGDGRQVAAFSSGRNTPGASLYCFDVASPLSFFVGVDESGTSLITAKGSINNALSLRSADYEPSSLSIGGPRKLDGFMFQVEKDKTSSFRVHGENGAPRVSITVREPGNDSAELTAWGARGRAGAHIMCSPALIHSWLSDGGGGARSMLGLIPSGDAEFGASDATSTPRIRFGWDKGGRPAVIRDDPERRDAPILH